MKFRTKTNNVIAANPILKVYREKSAFRRWLSENTTRVLRQTKDINLLSANSYSHESDENIMVHS